jgi:hypothetical protein
MGTALTALLSVPVVGLVGGSGGSPLNPFRAPTAAASELPRFSSCDELRDWYVTRAVRQVGPWGFGYGNGYWATEALAAGEAARVELDGGTMSLPVPEAAGDSGRAVGSSTTGTNVQEVGVDEPDVAKTDGALLVQARGRDLVVADVSGDEPVQRGRLELPARLSDAELLLAGDTVVVISRGQFVAQPTPLADVAGRIGPVGSDDSRVLTVSVADPGRLEITSDQEFEGSIISARQYGDTVRLALRTGLPELAFRHGSGQAGERLAESHNRRVVRETTAEDWLPTVTVDGHRQPLLGCDDVRHPRGDSGAGTLTIVTFDAETPEQRSATAVTTSGDLVYSSEDRLYVATPVYGGRPDSIWRLGREAIAPRTEIHAFALDGTATTYVASGQVRGLVRDRWAMDEHDGDLRVAVVLTRGWSDQHNGVAVLRQDGSRLEVVGSVGGMGPQEEIKSVRWFDDLAIVVTFRQVDPLYTIDLSEPSDPRVLGELKIPGFSSYLHPIGDDRLLGLGTAATRQGLTRGAQMSVFDISRLRDPDQLSVLRFGNSTELAAAWDPRSFTYLPGSATAFTTLADWRTGGQRVLKVRVADDGTLSKVDNWSASWDVRALPLPDDRVVLAGESVRIVPAG